MNIPLLIDTSEPTVSLSQVYNEPLGPGVRNRLHVAQLINVILMLPSL